MVGTQTISKPPARKRQQIAQRLREMTTTMSPGERLPSVLDLARQFGVATDTVKVALGVLSREGSVVSAPAPVRMSRNGPDPGPFRTVTAGSAIARRRR